MWIESDVGCWNIPPSSEVRVYHACVNWGGLVLDVRTELRAENNAIRIRNANPTNTLQPPQSFDFERGFLDWRSYEVVAVRPGAQHGSVVASWVVTTAAGEVWETLGKVRCRFV